MSEAQGSFENFQHVSLFNSPPWKFKYRRSSSFAKPVTQEALPPSTFADKDRLEIHKGLMLTCPRFLRFWGTLCKTLRQTKLRNDVKTERQTVCENVNINVTHMNNSLLFLFIYHAIFRHSRVEDSLVSVLQRSSSHSWVHFLRVQT